MRGMRKGRAVALQRPAGLIWNEGGRGGRSLLYLNAYHWAGVAWHGYTGGTRQTGLSARQGWN